MELKDERTKELVTKADMIAMQERLKGEFKTEIKRLEGKFKSEIQRLDGRIEKMNMKLNFLIILMIIALTLMNPVAADLIKRLF